MSVDVSKILTMKVKDYCDLKGKNPKDYDFVGVNKYELNEGCGLDPFSGIAGKSPKKAEVVLELEYQLHKRRYPAGDELMTYCAVTAIALVPKKQKEKK